LIARLRTGSIDGMQAPQWLAQFNKYVTNPVQRLWAGWAPGMAILEHVGRTSGRHYRTPLIVFSATDGIAVLLTYGPNRDWLKNVRAANNGEILRHGRRFEVTEPRVMTKAEAAPSVTGALRFLFPILPFDEAVLLRRI
jgi:deazaflavin-dependent oxidoreductase (nitroreductase family)